MKTPHFLHTEEGKQFLLERYVNNQESAYTLAKELNTHGKKIYRALKKHNLPIRSKAESQKLALEKGRANHPTKGKPRDMKVKNQIGQKMHNYWKSLPPETIQARIDASREIWDNIPEKTRELMLKKSHVALRKAAQDGSKVEKMILTALIGQNYKCQVHKKFLFPDSECSVDIYLPIQGICIEINGPSHYLPIWGEERLKETVERDLAKVEQLLANGHAVIIIQNPKGYYSKSAISEFLKKFIPFMKNVCNCKTNTHHEITIGDI